MGNSVKSAPIPFQRYVLLLLPFCLISFLTLWWLNAQLAGTPMLIPYVWMQSEFLLWLGALLLLYYLSDAARLYCVVRAMGYHVPLATLLRLVFINLFVSNVTPMSTGGGFVQIVFLVQQQVPLGIATAATSVRTILAALIIFAATLLIVVFNPSPFSHLFSPLVLTLVAVISLLYFAFFGLALFKMKWLERRLFGLLLLGRRFGWITHKQVRRSYRRLAADLGHFNVGIRQFTQNRSRWTFLAIATTFLFLIVMFGFAVTLIRSLGYDISVGSIMQIQTVVTFLMYFAPTPGASGIAEGGFGMVIAPLLNPEHLAVVTLAWRFLTIYLGVAIGVFALYFQLKQPKRVLEQ